MNECAKIWQRIRELREKSGITQDRLAKELAISRETVVKWENGERDLKTEYTIKLADYFGVTCDYILRGVKAENISINKLTGLSDEAIISLTNLNKISSKFGWDVISYILTSSYFTDIVNLIAEIGYYALNHKNENSLIENRKIIRMDNIGFAEMVYSLENPDNFDSSKLWSSMDKQYADTIIEHFGHDSVLVSGKELYKRILPIGVTELLNKLIDKLIKDAENKQLPTREGKTEVEEAERLLKIISNISKNAVMEGRKSKEEADALINELILWRNDVIKGEKTIMEYISHLKAAISKEGIRMVTG